MSLPMEMITQNDTCPIFKSSSPSRIIRAALSNSVYPAPLHWQATHNIPVRQCMYCSASETYVSVGRLLSSPVMPKESTMNTPSTRLCIAVYRGLRNHGAIALAGKIIYFAIVCVWCSARSSLLLILELKWLRIAKKSRAS